VLKIHVVKAGDTLFELAKKYNVNLDKLIAANPGLANPDKLEIGMKIKIPTGSVSVAPEGMHAHTVKQGDTMWKLSKAFGVSLKSLIEANPHINNPNILMTGQVVHIPKQTSAGGLGMGSNHQSTVGAAPKTNTAPIAAAPKTNTAPIATAPKANTAPVTQAPKTNTAPIAETPKTNTAPVEVKPVEKKEETKPIEAKPVAPKPVAPKPVENVKPVETKPMENAKPQLQLEKPTQPQVKPSVSPASTEKPSVVSPTWTTKPSVVSPTWTTKPSVVSPTSTAKPSVNVQLPQLPTYPQSAAPSAFSTGMPMAGYGQSEQLFMQYQVQATEAFSDMTSSGTTNDNANWPGFSPYGMPSGANLAAQGMPAQTENAAFSPYAYSQQPLYSADQTPAPDACGEAPAISPYVTFAADCGCQGGIPYGYPQMAAVSPAGYNPWMNTGNAPFQPQAVAGMENAMLSPASTGGANSGWYTPQAVAGMENAMLSPASTGGANSGWYTPQAVAGTENAMLSPASTGGANSGWYTPQAVAGMENAPAAAATGKPEAMDMSGYQQAGWGWPSGYPAGGPGAYSAAAYPGPGMFPSGVPGVYNPMAGPIPYPAGLYGFQPGFRETPSASPSPQPEAFTDATQSDKKPTARKRKAPAKATVHALAHRNKKMTIKPERTHSPWINQYR
jgi:LysM repeat protein